MAPKHRTFLLILVALAVAACGGPAIAATAPGGGLTALDLTATAEVSATYSGLADFDKTATAEAGATHSGLTHLDETATAEAVGHGHHEYATSTPLPPAAFTPSATVTIKVDGGARYQTISGFGATFRPFNSPFSKLDDPNGPSFTTASDGQRQGIADILFRQLGLSRFRVFPADYVKAAAGNSDPFALNPAGFDWTIVDQEVAFIALTQPIGLRTPWASFSLDGGADTAWLRKPGSPCALNPAGLDKDVEWLYVAAKHFSDAGYALPYLTVNNEPDLCPPGYKIEVADYVTILKQLGARLRRDGLNTRMVVSDGWMPQNALLYMQATLADPAARQYVGALAYHAYADGYDDPAYLLEHSAQSQPPHAAVAVRQKIRDLAAQYNLPVWMTEVCYCTPRSGFSEFELLRARLNHLHDELTIGNVSAFDAINLYNIRRPGVYDELVEVFYRADGSLERYQLAVYGQLLGQYSRFIAPDSVRARADSSDPRLRVMAFIRPDGKVVVVALNNNSFAVQADIALAGLAQTPTAFSVLTSREGAIWQTPPDTPLSQGAASLALAPLSVTTLVGK